MKVQLAELRERRWRAADARVVLEAHALSGTSVSAFAREHGLDTQRIFWWRKRLDAVKDKAPSPSGISFAPVVVTGAGGSAAAVVRAGGVEVEVIDPARIEPAWLAELLRATEKA